MSDIVEIRKNINIARFGLSEKQFARLLPATVDKMLATAAKATVAMLKTTARRKKIVAFGKYLAGWQLRRAGVRTYHVFNDVPYAKWAEAGRGPGKRPPIEPLKAWAQLKLGNANAAWGIATNIAKRGTVARNRFVSSGSASDAKIRKIIRDGARKILGAAMKRAF